jgi:hypothetical protein
VRNRPDGRSNLLHLTRVAVAVEGKIAAGSQCPPRPFADCSAECPHRQIVGDENAVEADFSADNL